MTTDWQKEANELAEKARARAVALAISMVAKSHNDYAALAQEYAANNWPDDAELQAARVEAEAWKVIRAALPR